MMAFVRLIQGIRSFGDTRIRRRHLHHHHHHHLCLLLRLLLPISCFRMSLSHGRIINRLWKLRLKLEGWLWHFIYRVSRGECARLRENVPYVKVHLSNPKRLYPKLNGYGDNGERKVWSSCGSTYCTCFVCCYPYAAHVYPSVSQPSQAHSAFIINRCHNYSEF